MPRPSLDHPQDLGKALRDIRVTNWSDLQFQLKQRGLLSKEDAAVMKGLRQGCKGQAVVLQIQELARMAGPWYRQPADSLAKFVTATLCKKRGWLPED
eukprot:2757345-Amphidinium_carterae.1